MHCSLSALVLLTGAALAQPEFQDASDTWNLSHPSTFPSALSPRPTEFFESAGSLGHAMLASIPDQDGDGIRDHLIGAPGQLNNGRVGTGPNAVPGVPVELGPAGIARLGMGAVFVVSGATHGRLIRVITPAGLPGDLRCGERELPVSNFGNALTLAPDLDGDGIEEIVVSAVGIASQHPGAVFVFSGKDLASPSGPVLLAHVTYPRALAREVIIPAWFGADVTILEGPAGPLLAVSAAWVDAFGNPYFPSTRWPCAPPDRRQDPPAPTVCMNGGVFFFDLVPGDGTAEVISASFDGPYPRFLPGPWSASDSFVFAARRFGGTLEPYPDVDGDGAEELLITAAMSDLGDGAMGRVYRFTSARGCMTEIARGPSHAIDAPQLSYFGHALLVLPDLDDDGYPEVAVGSPGELSTRTQGAASQARRSGAVHILSGEGSNQEACSPPDPRSPGYQPATLPIPASTLKRSHWRRLTSIPAPPHATSHAFFGASMAWLQADASNPPGSSRLLIGAPGVSRIAGFSPMPPGEVFVVAVAAAPHPTPVPLLNDPIRPIGSHPRLDFGATLATTGTGELLIGATGGSAGADHGLQLHDHAGLLSKRPLHRATVTTSSQPAAGMDLIIKAENGAPSRITIDLKAWLEALEPGTTAGQISIEVRPISVAHPRRHSNVTVTSRPAHALEGSITVSWKELTRTLTFGEQFEIRTRVQRLIPGRAIELVEGPSARAIHGI